MAKADDEGNPRSAASRQGPAAGDPDVDGQWHGRLILATWAALPVLALSGWLVPDLRSALLRMLWVYLALVVVFLVCRTKTVTWWFTSQVFLTAVLAVPLIAAVELVVAGIAGLDVYTAKGAVYVAGPVEETLKLASLAGMLLFFRSRLATFAVTDYLLLGFATGAGVQAVEEALHALAGDGGGKGVALAAAAGLSGTDARLAQATFAGHHVATALVLVAVGLAARGARRLGPLVWALPVLTFAMVVVDHALSNATVGWVPPGPLPQLGVPGWLVTLWDLWGSGAQERGLLAGLLVVALVADVRRTRRVWLLLPPVPDLGFVEGLRRWSNRAAVSLRGWVPAGAPRSLAVLAAAGAGCLRWLGYAAADLLGELALLAVAAGRDRTHRRPASHNGAGPDRAADGGADRGASDQAADRTASGRTAPDRTVSHRGASDRTAHDRTTPERTAPDRGASDRSGPDRSHHESAGPDPAGAPLPRRWIRVIDALRLRRRFAQRIGREAERSEVAPSRLPTFAAAALASVVLLFVALAVYLPGIGAAPGNPSVVALALRELGAWWGERWFVPRALTVLSGAALLVLLGAGLRPAPLHREPVAAAEDLLNHFGRVLRRYVTERTPGETVGYLSEYLMSRLLPVPRRRGVRLARRQLDRMGTHPGTYTRAEQILVSRLRDGEDAVPRRREMPRYIGEQLRAGRRGQARRLPAYRQNPVLLDGDRRFDGYLPERAIVSRKFSQLGHVKQEIAIGYLGETLARFTPGDVLADTPYNRSNFRTLIGTKLRGEIRLEAPVQEAAIPPPVLAAADQLGVVIVDEAGKVYNP